MVKSLLRMMGLLSEHRKRFIWFAVVSIGYAAFTSVSAPLCREAFLILESRATPLWMSHPGTIFESKWIIEYFPSIIDLKDWIIVTFPSLLGLKSVLNDLKPRKAFFIIIGVAPILIVFRCLCMYGRRYLQSWLTQRVVVDTQNKLANHLLAQDLEFYHNERAGDLLSRLTNDLLYLGESVKLTCILATRPITIFFFLFQLFYMNWELAMFALTTAPIAGFAINTLSRKMRKAAKKVQQKRADITSSMVQFLNGIRTVKAFACEDFESKQFKGQNQNYFEAAMKRERARSRVRPVVEFTSFFSVMIVLVIAGEWFFRGKSIFGESDLRIADLTAFLVALGMMYAPAKEMSKANSDFQVAIPGAERVFEIFDRKPVVKEGSQELGEFKNLISFENLSFEYVNDTPVLQNINLDIHKGECIALVGPSGAGKSTLTDLIMRFYDPTKGLVTIDNHDLRTLNFASVRDHIALVSQDSFLFNCPVRDNIAYGRADVSQEELERAAKAANIHDEIMALENGYDTVVGERGDNLSGGQRQRVAIARAIFKNAPILILDEATSALDSKNERKVQEALEHLMENRTSIVIAHRLSTVRHADRIIVMEEGQIISQGTHDELLKSCPVYTNLVQLQGGGS